MAFTTREGKTQTALAEINMIPFIDIMLVLLIIFMITAPVIQSGVQIDVPKTEVVRELSENLLVVSIDQSDRLFLQDAEVHISNIAEQIKAKLPLFKRQSVYFRADRKVSWETTTGVLDVLTQAGITNVVIVTEPLEGK
jgi:biopolymer transport protein ExbD/biopolymer transport protein TolR